MSFGRRDIDLLCVNLDAMDQLIYSMCLDSPVKFSCSRSLFEVL